MNIFWLDDDTTRAAQYHCDKHVVKMCVEYAQLLSSAMHILAPERCSDTFPYKLTHKNHPCAIWTRKSYSNFILLRHLAIALGDEFTLRYGKEHKSIEIIKLMPTDFAFPNIEQTEPPQCRPDLYKSSNRVEAYRKYYLN